MNSKSNTKMNLESCEPGLVNQSFFLYIFKCHDHILLRRKEFFDAIKFKYCFEKTNNLKQPLKLDINLSIKFCFVVNNTYCLFFDVSIFVPSLCTIFLYGSISQNVKLELLENVPFAHAPLILRNKLMPSKLSVQIF